MAVLRASIVAGNPAAANWDPDYVIAIFFAALRAAVVARH